MLEQLRYDPHVQVLAGLILAAAVLRFTTLDLQSYGDDEPSTISVLLQPSFFDMLERMASTERSGPVYYVLAWIWSQLFGVGEVGLRSLSALFGTFTVLVAYLAASELASRRAGLIAAALVAVNPYLFWYSQEARSYGLLTLFSGVTLLFLARALKRRTRRDLGLWAGTSVAAVASHYFAVFLVAPQALWLLYTLRSRRAVATVAAAGAGGLALLPLALAQQGEGRRDLFTAKDILERLVAAGVKFSGGEGSGTSMSLLGVDRWGLKLGAVVAVLGLLGLALLVVRGASAERRGGLLAAGLGVLALVLPVGLALLGFDVVKPKNLIVALVPLLVAAAAGFGGRGAGRLGLAGAAAMTAIFMVSLVAMLTTPALQRPDWRGVADAIGTAEEPRLVLAPLIGDGHLAFYLEGGVVRARTHVEQAGHERLAVESARVTEIAVAMPSGGASQPAPGFQLVERDSIAGFELLRYRADRPRPVRIGRIDGRRLVGPKFVVLIQGGETERAVDGPDRAQAHPIP